MIIDIQVQISHTLFPVIEVGNSHRTGYFGFILRKVYQQVGRDASVYLRGERRQGEPWSDFHAVDVDLQRFLPQAAMGTILVYGFDNKVFVGVYERNVGVEVFPVIVGKEIIGIQVPCFESDNGIPYELGAPDNILRNNRKSSFPLYDEEDGSLWSGRAWKRDAVWKIGRQGIC